MYAMREDNSLLVLTHLSQLLSSFLVPLILWLTQKDKIFGMDKHGKMILNFQISMCIYSLASIPLMLFLGLGVVVIMAVALLSFVLPILNAIKVNNGEEPNYPLSLNIIK
ncbi:DUF4870 domain-containing protein [Neptunitalea lumnitzerae]|uniref:DUF4870 domain-containing protein n=1 Tax=Neptunitalea lumnitzerae TaxID=2965509 RepID=A0ABQ5MJH8_9FLAO|nr:DUF4870 domain-containing protein [Neptunitalea sp. Y10]GLB49568.1 hypothetical protein Y10_19360 [Neptunitalea sp. Y10]